LACPFAPLLRDIDAKLVALAMAGALSILRDVGGGRWKAVSSPPRLGKAHG
jgi:hypothetical protein